MKLLVWIGIAMMVVWGVLWFGIKLAMGAIHVLLVLGFVLFCWGLLQRHRAPGR
ncbi:MAG TPA: hypothetical protein VL494_15935 [Steroidobacteraceae bacterium]|jgi:hypothetical protein|nr:hypothetical protein [Steroidobacteraceae bacterium]